MVPKAVIFLSLFILSTNVYSAPYPDSQRVTGIKFDWSTHQRSAQGSDNWPVTWCDDDHQYTSWGDGGGFGDTRKSLGYARLEGTVDQHEGYNLWTSSGKSYAILCINGTIYSFVTPGSNATGYDHATLYKSENKGKSFSETNVRWSKSDGIVKPAFLNFGKNYTNARDNYVYSYWIHLQNPTSLAVQKPGRIYLARVPKGKVEDQSAYEWFTGMESSPSWGSFGGKKPVFQDANGVGWNLSVSYNAPLKRYFLITEHGKSFSGNIGIFEASEPWGPWRTVHYVDDFGAGTVEQTTFYWNFSNKWLSSDGKQFVMIFTGTKSNDSFNTVVGNFELAGTSENHRPGIPQNLHIDMRR